MIYSVSSKQQGRIPCYHKTLMWMSYGQSVFPTL